MHRREDGKVKYRQDLPGLSAKKAEGQGVFDEETIGMLYNQAYGLHVIIDGNAIGTFKQCSDERAREETARMKPVSSLDEL